MHRRAATTQLSPLLCAVAAAVLLVALLVIILLKIRSRKQASSKQELDNFEQDNLEPTNDFAGGLQAPNIKDQFADDFKEDKFIDEI